MHYANGRSGCHAAGPRRVAAAETEGQLKARGLILTRDFLELTKDLAGIVW